MPNEEIVDNQIRKSSVQSEKTEKSTAKVDRPQWNNYAEFILSCIGYSVGLGNIWRFPYLAYVNGGGAFLIPYWISVILAGLPFYFLELSLGQYSSLGANCVFTNLAPVFQGVGWAMVVVSFLVTLYYNMIVAWVLFYLVDSFRSKLRWASCTNDYNTNSCHSNVEDRRCETELNDTAARYYAKQCWNASSVSAFGINQSIAEMSRISPAEEYFNRFVLNVSDSFEETGGISWKLALCLAAAWLLVFACLFAGIQSSGKAVYVTATLPYLVLLILLIRGATLPGAKEGILFYVVPDFQKLKNVKVWVDAAVQVFYSLGPAFGGLITMASYNPFRNNCCRDAIIVSLVDSFTSMFAGCAIFSITGFMAHDLNVPVGNVTRSGMGLAFIAYPEAIVRMPVSQLWSVLFFLMLVMLGLDSEFSMLETCTTALMDQFPRLRRWKTLVIGLACLACFLIGLIMCTRAGIYYFVIFNDYSSGYCLILIALVECLLVAYVYGMKNFVEDLRVMLGFAPWWYFRICWWIISPAFMIFILIFTFIGYERSSYDKVVLSGKAEIFGWIVSALSIVCIPAFALYRVYQNRRLQQPWRALITPTADYAPADVRTRRRRSSAKVTPAESTPEVTAF